jgi:hypothetical protein
VERSTGREVANLGLARKTAEFGDVPNKEAEGVTTAKNHAR